MDNLSFHITDITANSIRAKAFDIEIDIQIKDTSICIRIADNGCGMDPENPRGHAIKSSESHALFEGVNSESNSCVKLELIFSYR